MGLGLMIVLCLAVLLGVLIFGLTKSILLIVLLGIILTIAFYVAFIFVTSWIGLATVSVLISDEKLGAIETFKKVKPLVWGYFWMNIVVSFFMFGLLPLGALSLGVIFVLWALWSSFLPFVYLKTQKKGLENLWISREMFRQRPWGLFGRLMLINLAVFAISFFISYSGKNATTSGLSFLFSILSAPFVLSFEYEMFQNLKEVKEAKKPNVWFVLSVIGCVLMILAFVAAIVLITQAAMNSFNQYQNNPQRFFQNFIPTPTTIYQFQAPVL